MTVLKAGPKRQCYTFDMCNFVHVDCSAIELQETVRSRESGSLLVRWTWTEKKKIFSAKDVTRGTPDVTRRTHRREMKKR